MNPNPVSLLRIACPLLFAAALVVSAAGSCRAADTPVVVPCGRTYGGPGRDVPQAMAATADGGTVIAGFSDPATGWDPADGLSSDAWILKLDAKGDTQWTATYGDTGWDGATSILQTADGGYLVAGVTGDNEWNIRGRQEMTGTGGVNEDNSGQIWLLRLDSSGNQIWVRTFGRNGNDTGTAMARGLDGSYAMAAAAGFSGIRATDLWFVPLNPALTPAPPASYGGRYPFSSPFVALTPDNGAVLAGSAPGMGEDLSDIVITRVGPAGNVLWTEHYGTTEKDYAAAIAVAPDGGIVVAGYVFTPEPLNNTGSYDFYAIELDSQGKKQWSRILTAKRDDRPASIAMTGSGNVILAGTTYTNTKGEADARVVMLGSDGVPVWDKSLGTKRDDRVSGVMALPDGRIRVSASTKMPEPAESYDFWIFTLDSTGTCSNP